MEALFVAGSLRITPLNAVLVIVKAVGPSVGAGVGMGTQPRQNKAPALLEVLESPVLLFAQKLSWVPVTGLKMGWAQVSAVETIVGVKVKGFTPGL